jgi:hypothetical protein
LRSEEEKTKIKIKTKTKILFWQIQPTHLQCGYRCNKVKKPPSPLLWLLSVNIELEDQIENRFLISKFKLC